MRTQRTPREIGSATARVLLFSMSCPVIGTGESYRTAYVYDAIGERLLTASTPQEALGSH